MPLPSWKRVGGLLVSVLLATSQTAPTIALAEAAITKSETVRVQTDGSGAVSDITVDSLLSNDDGLPELDDESRLTDISTKDDGQSYTTAGNGGLVWTTDGKQVSYQGTSDDELPVDVRVSYRLDGEACQPSELAGASGHLVMRIDYTNLTPTREASGGSGHSVRTPFVCMTVAMLDSEVFSGVEVTNGRVLEDKGGIAVVGYALPGLNESLKFDDADQELDLDFPEFVEISADVTDLTLDPIYTIVTPELFYDLDTKDLDVDLDDLDEGTDALDEAMSVLIEGSGTLTSTLGALAKGSKALGGGIMGLREALGALPTGVTALSTGMQGITEALDTTGSGAAKLSDGAAQLSEAAQGALAVVGGSKESVATAQTEVGDLRSALENISGTREAVSAADDAAQRAHDAAVDAASTIKGLDTSLKAQKDPVSDALTKASSDVGDAEGKLESAVGTFDEAAASIEGIPTEGLTEEQLRAIETVRAQVRAARDAASAVGESLGSASGGLSDAQAKLDAMAIQAPEGLEKDAAALDGAANELSESGGKISDSSEALGEAKEAEVALSAVSASVDASAQLLEGVAVGSGRLESGASALAGALAQTSAGANTIADGINVMAVTSPQLLLGVDQLGSGSEELTEALEATADGSTKLTDGISKLNEEGIKKLEDALRDFGGNVDDIRGRLDDLRSAAEDYDNFSGKAEGQTGSVRFVYKTAQIG